MDLPLVLRRIGETRLVYGIPLWYRLVMGGILALLVASLVVAGGTPGLVAWIVLSVALLAFLYEERWDFDRTQAVLVHSYGLLLLSKRGRVPFASIKSFYLMPWVRGSIPGSDEERLGNESTLLMSRGGLSSEEKSGRRPSLFRKPYLSLAIETEEGRLIVNMAPARRSPALRAVAVELSDFCSKPLEEAD